MFANILHLIVYTLMSLFLVIVVLRFLLQLVRADFYNPLSQALVKITMPLLRPLRKLIPSILGIDTASVVLILLVQLLATAVLCLVLGLTGLLTSPVILLWGAVGALSIIANLFFWCMIISIIGSFIAPMSHHPLLSLANQIIDPLCKPIRKVIPPLGGVIDISPIIVLLGLQIVEKILIRELAIWLQLNPQVVLGYWY